MVDGFSVCAPVVLSRRLGAKKEIIAASAQFSNKNKISSPLHAANFRKHSTVLRGLML
jgi:hypothetical protein